MSEERERLAQWCLKASSAIYLATDAAVADDIAPKLREIAALLRTPAAPAPDAQTDDELVKIALQWHSHWAHHNETGLANFAKMVAVRMQAQAEHITRQETALAQCYREGAKAMREATLAVFDNPPVEHWPTGWREKYPALALPSKEEIRNRIRHLPLPGDHQ